MNSYHGTSSATASKLNSGPVDVTIGGGELGRGFYSGQHLHEAKAWAFHQSGNRTANVVEFETSDADFEALDILLKDAKEAGLERLRIRKARATRTALFDVDVVWAPIVGSERASGDQFKWESVHAGDLLNDPKKTRKRII